MPYNADILKKITQLTLIREEEPLVEAFFELMLSEFDLIQGVALYKLDQLSEDSLPHLQASSFDSSVKEDIFNQEDFKITLAPLFLIFLEENVSFEDTLQVVDGQKILIKKSNRDKTSLFFLVYWFSGSDKFELRSDFISDALSNQENKNSQITNIHSLSDIYTNHQTMIYLNDKDSLTGLYNRKSFDRRMHRCLTINSHHRRSDQDDMSNCLAILDIDHFKRVNDTYGHLYGDEVLLHFAQQMQKIFREEDELFRYGGEEFVVILKNLDIKLADKVLNRFRLHIEAYQFPKVDNLTVSIGYTVVENKLEQSKIVDRADHALYHVKEHGRNNVACYETLVEEGILHEVVTEDDIELF